MPITKLDPKSALVVVDLQNGVAAQAMAHPVEDVVGRSAELAKTFRDRALPVVLVNVAGRPPGRTEQGSRAVGEVPDDFTDLLPALDPQSSDLLITKNTRGAFTHTGLEERLQKLGVTQVVITGIATSVGVESTARDAHERGFHVAVVGDAITDGDLDAHEHSLTQVFPQIGEIGTTDEVLALLGER